MGQEVADGLNDLEQLKRRFEEFRSTQTSRGRLPARCGHKRREVVRRYGLNPTAQTLRLDYNRLKRRMAEAPARSRSVGQKEFGSGVLTIFPPIRARCGSVSPEQTELLHCPSNQSSPVPGATGCYEVYASAAIGHVRREIEY